MSIPVAVSPATKSPGFYQLLNLLAGPASAGLSGLRALIISPKSSAGTITANSQVVQTVSGADHVKTLLGPGTPGHLAAVALFRAHGLAKVDVVAPTASAGAAATGTITLDDTTPISAAQTVTATIKGVPITISWLVGETDTTAATKLVAAINGATDKLPVTASNGNGTLTAVTLTAKIAGPWGNDTRYRVTLSDGAGGSVTAAGATLTGGTTEPDFSTVLGLVQTTEYDFILPCVSNADAQSNSATSNPGRIKTHIDAYDSGAQPLYQQQVVGCTGSLASTKTGAIGRNHGPTQYVLCVNGESLGCEWAGWEVGRRLKAEELDPAVNRIGDEIEGLYGPFDLVGDKPTAIETEDALSSGISIVDFDAQGDPFMVRPITTYSQDANGNPDYRLLDVSGVSGAYAFMKDLRVSVPTEFKGAKLSKDQAPGDDPLPAGVVEERDIKSFVLSRASLFVSRGILRRDKLNEAVANGTFIVQVDATDESQVNIVLPFGIVKPLAKFSMVGQRVA
ncbi:hypothetical protein [Sorangium sp. So ce1389]|uniref:hypothetical protein n=1 Tax=Sorangium sp. So ce1389 TaxID=3133336 RepID=UPI003F637238